VLQHFGKGSEEHVDEDVDEKEWGGKDPDLFLDPSIDNLSSAEDEDAHALSVWRKKTPTTSPFKKKRSPQSSPRKRVSFEETIPHRNSEEIFSKPTNPVFPAQLPPSPRLSDTFDPFSDVEPSSAEKPKRKAFFPESPTSKREDPSNVVRVKPLRKPPKSSLDSRARRLREASQADLDCLSSSFETSFEASFDLNGWEV
jgi:hypothetical protein